MRPTGEIRAALSLAMSAAPGTCRVLAERAGVGLTAARVTLDNMVRAGAAQKVALERVPGVKRPVPVYGEPGPEPLAEAGDGGAELFLVLSVAWGPER